MIHPLRTLLDLFLKVGSEIPAGVGRVGISFFRTLFSRNGLQTLPLLLASYALGEAPPQEGYERKVVVTPLLRTSETAAGQPIVYPSVKDPEVTAIVVEIPPGTETGWHKHPYPCYAYILAGALTVEVEGGRVNELKAGDALVESVNLLHNGKNTGSESVRLVMFVTGEKALPFTIKASKPN